MRRTIGELAHAHAGRAGVVIGGAPSRLTEIAACPADALYVSVNAHGLMARACDYVCAKDAIGETLKGRGAPVISGKPFADILVFERRLGDSAQLACFALWVMGCAPIIVIGVECYQGATYAHDPRAVSSGQSLTLAQHLTRWRALLNLAPGAMVRPVGGPLTAIFPRYDAREAPLPIADRDAVRAAAGGVRLKFTRPHAGYARDQVAEFSKSEARRLIAENAAVRCGAHVAESPAPVRTNPRAPRIYAVAAERTSPRFARAFALGCGGDIAREYAPGAWAGFGSGETWAGLNETRRAGRDWWYGDHAYFGRFRFYRVTRNAFQHAGVGRADYARWKRLNLTIRAWRASGRHVLVCPPDEAWARLMGFDAAAWLAETLAKLKANTDREVRIRARLGVTRPLEADLAQCWVLVTHASNAAVEALLAGVPVIATGDCAARTMGLADPVSVEYPRYPDNREEWAAVLAANQWTLAEIAAGECWERIGHAVV